MNKTPTEYYSDNYYMQTSHSELCPVCHGKGKISVTVGYGTVDNDQNCHGCGGCGWVTVKD